MELLIIAIIYFVIVGTLRLLYLFGHTSSSSSNDRETSRPRQDYYKNLRKEHYRSAFAYLELPEMCGTPFVCLYDYYPKKYQDISERDKQNRKKIWQFKDGYYKSVIDVLAGELRCILDDNLDYTFVCVPASSQKEYEMRCKTFSEELCRKVGIENGFGCLSVRSNRVPRHLGGSEKMDLNYEEGSCEGKHIILFDDLMTSGDSIREVYWYLYERGAYIDLIITLGKTCKPLYEEEDDDDDDDDDDYYYDDDDYDYFHDEYDDDDDDDDDHYVRHNRMFQGYMRKTIWHNLFGIFR